VPCFNFTEAFEVLRIAHKPVTTLAKGDALSGLPRGFSGPVRVEAAWLLKSDDAENTPSGSKIVVITSSARERIVLERSAFAASYVTDWQSFQKELDDYNRMNVDMPKDSERQDLDSYFRANVAADSKRPKPPAIEPLRLADGDVVAYVKHEPDESIVSWNAVPGEVIGSDAGISEKDEYVGGADGADPVTSELEKPWVMAADVYSGGIPLRLTSKRKSEHMRNDAYTLLGMIATLLVFYFVAFVVARGQVRKLAFVRRLRNEYAAAGIEFRWR
jgi:hypothetical protein